MIHRYDRQKILNGFGEIGQERLSKSSVVLIGLGGVASGVLPQLVSAGVGRIKIVDFDTISESNLNRQILYSEKDIGRYKVDVALEKMKALNSDIHIDGLNCRVDSKNGKEILKNFDFCIIATDSFSSKIEISEVCKIEDIRHIVLSAEGYEIQIAFLENKISFGDLFSDEEARTLKSEGKGIVGSIANLSGTILASSLIISIAKGNEEFFLKNKILQLNFENPEDLVFRKIVL